MAYIKIHRDELRSDTIFEQYLTIPNAITDGDCVTFYTRSRYEAINDGPMREQMINDLVDNYGHTNQQAVDWVTDNGHQVVSDMWDAYSKYFEDFAEDLSND